MTIDTIMRGLDGIERKLHQLPELSDRLLQLEQKAGTKAGDMPGTGRRTLGTMFHEELSKNMDLLGKTGRVRLNLELKAAGDAITTTSARSTLAGGAGAITGGVLGLQMGLPTRTVGSVTIHEYSRYTGMQGAAAQQATEGSAKAAVRPDHSIISQRALTLAGYAKMSKQALSDSEELKSAVDITLRRSIDTALDVALCNGATDFAGGFESLATAYTSLVYTAMPDAVSEGVSTMQVAGFAPNVVFLNPTDWLAISVAKGTANDHYLSGSYLGAMPMEMRGLRVVLSPSVDAGKALLMDTSHTELLVLNGVTVEAGNDADDFTKNLVTILAEVRVIPVFRATGAARLITPKA